MDVGREPVRVHPLCVVWLLAARHDIAPCHLHWPCRASPEAQATTLAAEPRTCRHMLMSSAWNTHTGTFFDVSVQMACRRCPLRLLPNTPRPLHTVTPQCTSMPTLFLHTHPPHPSTQAHTPHSCPPSCAYLTPNPYAMHLHKRVSHLMWPPEPSCA